MRYFILASLVCAALAAVAACGPPLGLPGAFITNKVDSAVSLYALTGTPVSQPSGYSIGAGQVVRTEQGMPFDFAFDIDTAGRAVLLPTGALKLGRQSGLQSSAVDFDSIKIAPTGGYNLDSAQVVGVDSVVILHSSGVTCSFNLPAFYYAKLRVVAIDTSSTSGNGRRIVFDILNDHNCGYRGLEPGLPKH
ncbi:MAG TPA: hypothetical protein VGJ80_01025 [Gemmatimonadales bacterium]|jgi:hypothetical protein|nr:hypothetical protein [Gemmatimonadales bacterium]